MARAFLLLTSRLQVANRGRYSTAAVAVMNEAMQGVMTSIHEAGTYKPERVITTRQATSIKVEGSSRDILNFCANNYLGLSSHPEVVNAAKAALDEYGAGLSSTRFICGTQNIHKDLEQKIATFHQKEDAILYASCFDANAGLFEALLTPDDAVISDELNHASIIDGIRLCKAERYRYKHMNVEDLESILQKTQHCHMRMIVTDGVFSMDGDVTPLREITDLANKYEALVFVDDCHATGFLGKAGRGTEEYLGIDGSSDIINSTLGKALGGASGGYTAGPKSLTDMLRQKSRPYLFSNTLPPPVVASASKVLDMIMEDPSLMLKLASNTKLFRDRMTQAGFTLWGKDHPICPIMLGEASLAGRFAEEMLKRGIYVIGFSFPVVPQGKARIRVQISAAHSEEEIERCVQAFIDVGKELKVI
ncbi:2-amino-3-ketobutyrate coenzyme A ligase, mitochondrial-like [Acanthaster planci]|uniref:2-amino-3-ketobutyrate coenzyme A ligase, mitochondrial n=1 Tax=Acanthaster planci TaxID=133434 RepID=A0A8B7Y050_ACAPL|nr:2-amino-3-ketobutyrate coenzyme A ligase, mitochondrial-like [Acanthaster planci]XP_022086516.1 2-amino-3-ketobutyrate coenzyme A ligase, mitochondrial-like [Acanthaster planci]XP_022086525.1 2-amino-3-ketobutyrate coenzyme A ligase, mitochondrial-like [Acanthaster planci]XP_022086534.1 2-amino-3-ketobutyrate coenzyme A ligase, mitochondrial-like [Acanthaster planci]